ncbi:hypothetical protein Tco_1356080, partial [Tanacetum coccineum]
MWVPFFQRFSNQSSAWQKKRVAKRIAFSRHDITGGTNIKNIATDRSEIQVTFESTLVSSDVTQSAFGCDVGIKTVEQEMANQPGRNTSPVQP